MSEHLSPERYEAPRLTVIGAVRDFTFGSTNDNNSDNTTVHTGHNNPKP
jgi:hypothetical protein